MHAWTDGDQAAQNELMPLVSTELRGIARHQWGSQPPGQTLQPTALIQKAFLKIAGSRSKDFQNRAESSLARKRGGMAKVPLETVDPAVKRGTCARSTTF